MTLLELILSVTVATGVGLAIIVLVCVRVEKRHASNMHGGAWSHDDSYLDAGEHPQFKREDKDD